MNGGEARLLRVGGRHEHVRRGELPPIRLRVSGVTIGAADVVAPVLAAAEVVVLFLAGVTSQTGLGDLFGRFVLERDDLFRVAFFAVRLAGGVTRLATRHLILPTANLRELRMRRVRERLELIFVTVLARVAADIAVGVARRDFALRRWG